MENTSARPATTGARPRVSVASRDGEDQLGHEDSNKENAPPSAPASFLGEGQQEGLTLKRATAKGASAVRLSTHDQQQITVLRQQWQLASMQREEGEENASSGGQPQQQQQQAKLRRMGQLGRRSMTPLRELFQQTSSMCAHSELVMTTPANSSSIGNTTPDGTPQQNSAQQPISTLAPMSTERTASPHQQQNQQHASPHLANVARMGKRKSDADTVLERLAASGDGSLNSPSKRRRTCHRTSTLAEGSRDSTDQSHYSVDGSSHEPAETNGSAISRSPQNDQDGLKTALPLTTSDNIPVREDGLEPCVGEEPPQASHDATDPLAVSLNEIETRLGKKESFLRRTFSVKKLKLGTCTSNSDPRLRFVRLLTEQELAISIALLDIGGEDMAKSIIQVLDGMGQALRLIKASLFQELATTASEGTLFRGASISTQLVSHFMRSHGRQYLEATFSPFFAALLSANTRIEVDPNRAIAPELVNYGCEELIRLTRTLLETVFSSTSAVPHALKDLFAYLQAEVVKRFPHMKDKVVGGFFFLRFVCPALVSPEQWGFANGLLSPAVRRTLILISKVVQNVANELEFGDKEAYMRPMNDLVQDHIPQMKDFLCAIAASSPSSNRVVAAQDLGRLWGDDDFLDSLFTVYDAVAQNMDRLRTRLASAGHEALADELHSAMRELPSPRDDQLKLMSKKRTHKMKKLVDRQKSRKEKRHRRSLSDTELDSESPNEEAATAVRKKETPGRRQLNRILSTSKKLLPKFASDHGSHQEVLLPDQASQESSTPRKFLKARRKASTPSSSLE